MSSSLGQGSMGFTAGTRPSGAPFAATSADNGLSVDPVSGKIVLGEDNFNVVATYHLKSDRFINTNAGFKIIVGRITVATQSEIAEDAVRNVNRDDDRMGSLAAGALSLHDPAFNAPVIQLTTANNANQRQIMNNAGDLQIQDENNVPFIQTGPLSTTIFANLKQILGLTEDGQNFGDVTNVLSFLSLLIDQTNKKLKLTCENAAGNAPVNFFQIEQRIVSVGDVDNNENGTKITVDDNSQVIALTTNGSLEINGTPGFSGTVANPSSITVVNGIVTDVQP